MRKSKTPDLDEIIASAQEEAGMVEDPPENYDGPEAPLPEGQVGESEAPPAPAPAKVEHPRTPSMANVCLEDLPEGASTHEVLADTLAFCEHWAARSDPGEFRERVLDRLRHLLGHYPARA